MNHEISIENQSDETDFNFSKEIKVFKNNESLTKKIESEKPNNYFEDNHENVCPWMKNYKENFEKNNFGFNNLLIFIEPENGNDIEVDEYNETNETKMPLWVKTSDVRPSSNASFSKYNLNANILQILKEKKWNWPSPIQEATLTKIINGENIIARSKNGTGKTGAYSIALINKIDSKKKIQTIIIVPTRELALQTASVCISLAKYLKDVHVMVTTGGTNLSEDIYRLKNTVNILVGTPGRISDFLSLKLNTFSEVESVVLDEADKLLSGDFQAVIETILTMLPVQCQKLLFSATYPLDLKPFVDKYIGNCVQCNVMNELTLKGITQYYAYLIENQKLSCLKILMRNLKIQQSIIFCNSTKRTELLAKVITEMGHSSYYIHAKINQEARNRIFHDFRSGFVKYLVCTDIMSRGIDISSVNVVINFDFPNNNETYLHRIGRCGRFGHLGIAINFITDSDKNRFKICEKELDTKIYAIPQNIDDRLYASA